MAFWLEPNWKDRMSLKLKDVFTPGGIPSITYVEREELKLEDKIRNAVIRGYAINVVTGATKSGKSVLCHRVLGERKLITVEGGQVQSEEEFWTHIAHQLRLASESTESSTIGNNVGVEAGGGWKLGFDFSAKAKTESASESTTQVTYSNVLKLACIDALINNGAALLVDDFHYIDSATQKKIIQGVKGPVMRGLAVFLLAVPHRAFDPMTVENEVEGRFKHIPIPPWQLTDLQKIPRVGFAALNFIVAEEVQARICDESFGNPLLVQEACSEFAIANNCVEFVSTKKQLDSAKLDVAFTEMATSKGFPKYQKLKKGPQARKARQVREMKDGAGEDIYAAIMKSIARTGPKPLITYNEIRASLKELMGEGRPLPQKNEITSALNHMTAIAKKEIKGEPPLEWIKDEDELVITDPFLLFYMKHASDL